MRAQDYMMRQDRRKLRADSVASHIMRRIADMLYGVEQNLPKKVHEAILETLMTEGIDVLTDYDRMQMGLPTRDLFGWTDDEVRAYENKKLEIMLRPMPHMILPEPKKVQCPHCGEMYSD